MKWFTQGVTPSLPTQWLIIRFFSTGPRTTAAWIPCWRPRPTICPGLRASNIQDSLVHFYQNFNSQWGVHTWPQRIYWGISIWDLFAVWNPRRLKCRMTRKLSLRVGNYGKSSATLEQKWSLPNLAGMFHVYVALDMSVFFYSGIKKYTCICSCLCKTYIVILERGDSNMIPQFMKAFIVEKKT